MLVIGPLVAAGGAGDGWAGAACGGARARDAAVGADAACVWRCTAQRRSPVSRYYRHGERIWVVNFGFSERTARGGRVKGAGHEEASAFGCVTLSASPEAAGESTAASRPHADGENRTGSVSARRNRGPSRSEPTHPEPVAHAPGSVLAVRTEPGMHRCRPGGARENSPAIDRRVRSDSKRLSPVETIEVQPSLRYSDVPCGTVFPAVNCRAIVGRSSGTLPRTSCRSQITPPPGPEIWRRTSFSSLIDAVWACSMTINEVECFPCAD